MKHKDVAHIKHTLQQISPGDLVLLFKAFQVLDICHCKTIGPNWLSNSAGLSLPPDLASILSGNLTPDKNGILQGRI